MQRVKLQENNSVQSKASGFAELFHFPSNLIIII